MINVIGWKDIVAIAAGNRNTAGLKSDGTVVVVGHNWGAECNTSNWKNIGPVSKEDIERFRAEEQQQQKWKSKGLCIYCGGQLKKGFFSSTCLTFNGKQ